MPTLQELIEKQEKLQKQIEAQRAKETFEANLEKVSSTFSEAVRQAVSTVETEQEISLSEHDFGVWACYQNGALVVSVIKAKDGMPKGKAPAGNCTNGNGHTASANGEKVYYLTDGRGPFNTTLEALDAIGYPQDKRGQYYHRWDRLPKELQAQIVVKAQETVAA